MIPAAPPDATRRAVALLLEDLCAEYDIPIPDLEWSRRMRRVLGRAYIDNCLIRLSSWLAHEQALETLRHELAHIAVGKGSHQPHGPMWRQWAVRLGAEPRASARNPPAHADSLPSHRIYFALACNHCGVRFGRTRVSQSLYHKQCGAHFGKLREIFRGSRNQVFDWVTADQMATAVEEHRGHTSQ